MTLLAAGLNHADIAQRLVITPRTVTKHIEHILAKLGVHSRAEAVALVLRDETPGPVGRTRPAHGPNNATLK